MAYILGKSASGGPEPMLSRASLEQLADVYRLALMGETISRRQWNEYMLAQPATCRAVVAGVMIDDGETAKTRADIDAIIAKAEKSLYVPWKPKARLNKAAKAKKPKRTQAERYAHNLAAMKQGLTEVRAALARESEHAKLQDSIRDIIKTCHDPAQREAILRMARGETDNPRPSVSDVRRP
jgi:hypothetical protein